MFMELWIGSDEEFVAHTGDFVQVVSGENIR
jgi:quercetin dioxygenase-like cupin family protein